MRKAFVCQGENGHKIWRVFGDMNRPGVCKGMNAPSERIKTNVEEFDLNLGGRGESGLGG